VPEIYQSFQRQRWVRRAIPAAAVAVLVVGGTVMVRNSASASPVDSYRTTTVTKGSVEQRLDLTGSVQRVNQVSQSFAVSGTVSSVSVNVGDTVTTGETLASLDPKPLNSAVLDAEAALAQAKATLESDQSAATATTSTATAPPTQAVTPSTSPRVASPSGRSSASTNQSLVASQKGLARAQSALAADLRHATEALTQCEMSLTPPATPPVPPATPPVPPATPPVPPATPLGSTSTQTLTAPPSTPTSTPTDVQIKACLDALKATQQQIQRDQLELTKSQANLTKAFTLAITSASKTAAPSATTTRSTSTSQSSTSQSSTSRSGSTSQATGGQSGGAGQSAATRVISDQAAVTSAEATLSSAGTDLAAATLKSSIAGTVGSVTVVKGTSDQSESIVIVGAGAAEVTVNVPLTSMATVHVGQKARVTPQGATSSVPGSVTSISLLPSATSTGTGSGTGAAQSTAASTPTYPVVVRVPEALPALASGSRADVSLLIGLVTDVVTVPNSALTPLGNGQALALTFKGGLATRALVKTGYAGALTTQIASGLSVGQQVVLADLSTALPTNTTNARRFGVGAGAGGGIGGAGLGGAGLGGAGFGGAGSRGGTFTGRSGFTPGG
jgi:multidrug efflux pump subunit AcrA (membrane-fusion protein)